MIASKKPDLNAAQYLILIVPNRSSILYPQMGS